MLLNVLALVAAFAGFVVAAPQGLTFEPIPVIKPTPVITGPVIFTPIPSVITTPITFQPIVTITPTPVITGPITFQPIPTNCVEGGGVNVNNYYINYGLVAQSGTYAISRDFETKYQLATLRLDIGENSAGYGEYRCQDTCNILSGCVSFAGWIIAGRARNVNFECRLYSALVKTSDFQRTTTSSSRVTRAYNKLCSSRKLRRDDMFDNEVSPREEVEYEEVA